METLHNTYDAMERLLTISILRYGLDMYNTSLPTHIRNHGMIDNLTMTYDGNRLKKVTDQCEELSYAGAMDFKDGADKAEEYTYDANGNMTCDRNKGIHSITYNMLNLPETVLFNDGHETRYTYAADGRKLRTEYRLNNFAIIEADEEAEPANFSLPSVGGIIDDPIEVEPAYTTLMTRDYCGNYIYSNGTLERILTGNGYIQGGEYYFYIKDYQGNIRVVLNQANVPVELNSYYPYGALMAAIPSENQQPYKYGAKELDRENGLDLYDSQARHYDPIIPRTTTIDPLAEKYYSLSPYTWCAANPTRYIDPNGEKVELYATSLPGCELPLATHTFIVIRDQHNKVKGYYAYGSEYDGIKGCISGQLKRMSYHQDKMVYSGKDTEHLKKIIEIEPPSGMSETEFDHKVESVANSFGNNKQITYHFAPTISDMTEGNCNTSTSTILLKSGVSKSSIQNIKKEIPGISLGFSIIARPWTEQEQKNAVKYQEAADFLIDIISNP